MVDIYMVETLLRESQAFTTPPVDGVGADREKFSSRHCEKVVRFREADEKQSGGNNEEQAYLWTHSGLVEFG